MKRIVTSLALALAVAFGGLSVANADARTSDKGYKTARQAALRGGAYVMNQDRRLRNYMGKSQGGSKAISASQLITRGTKSYSPQGNTQRIRVATQKLGPNGRSLASTTVSVRQISKATQARTGRDGRWVAFTGASTGNKVTRPFLPRK